MKQDMDAGKVLGLTEDNLIEAFDRVGTRAFNNLEDNIFFTIYSI
jgi:hypothetical protein